MLPQYKEKLEEIKHSVIEIAKGLCRANEIILEAMADCNEERFANARGYIRNVGDKTNSIDNNIVKTLALYSPFIKLLVFEEARTSSFVIFKYETNRRRSFASGE
jgi:hypothetical protein